MDGGGPGKGATGTLFMNGEKVGLTGIPSVPVAGSGSRNASQILRKRRHRGSIISLVACLIRAV
jgi:hypothetical protein